MVSHSVSITPELAARIADGDPLRRNGCVGIGMDNLGEAACWAADYAVRYAPG